MKELALSVIILNKIGLLLSPKNKLHKRQLFINYCKLFQWLYTEKFVYLLYLPTLHKIDAQILETDKEEHRYTLNWKHILQCSITMKATKSFWPLQSF